MRHIRIAALALLGLTGFAAFLAGLASVGFDLSAGGNTDLRDSYDLVHNGRTALWVLAIAAFNLASVLWHSRVSAPASPLLSGALGMVLCGAALIVIAVEIPALHQTWFPSRGFADIDRHVGVAIAAGWLRVAGLLIIVAGWLGWAVGRFLAGSPR